MPNPVIITVRNGVVGLHPDGRQVRFKVRDYDCRGMDKDTLEKDNEGQKYWPQE